MEANRAWLKDWLMAGAGSEEEVRHPTYPWWKVMCLTGVDYFSTLGYQPGIAFLAAGALSPIATLVLVMLTLLGALPVYHWVAKESPHGEGSISMLEDLLPRWRGKLFVLVQLGFGATSFIITITLSAADATAHIVENPLAPELFEHHRVLITLALVAFLGALFLKGFREVIGLAVFLVLVYLGVNLVVIARGMMEIALHPTYWAAWKEALWAIPEAQGSPWLMVGISLFLFPKLALGLSGFETGVLVIPQVEGEPGDDPVRPQGRIRAGQKLLLGAALIMSVMLLLSSVVTTFLIAPEKFAPGGEANGRALAYLAHHFYGDLFGTVYDLSTIAILWFAGSSALAGLLNLVPRYLPRYGMAPDWARATRPLVVVFSLIAFLVTILFDADVDAQGGAYATGVLVLMSSASLAVMLAVWEKRLLRYPFLLITLAFAYTTLVNLVERPEGIKIASFFIGGIILTSLISRSVRSTELRIEGVELNETAKAILDGVSEGTIRIIASRPDRGDQDEYRLKEKKERWNNHIPNEDPIIFLEVRLGDVSEFSGRLRVRGVQIGQHRVLRTTSPSIPNAIAAFLLHVRDVTGQIPHAYFGWTEGNPVTYVLRFIFLGEGDTAPMTREVLRQAEPEPTRRPAVHVGG